MILSTNDKTIHFKKDDELTWDKIKKSESMGYATKLQEESFTIEEIEQLMGDFE